MCLEVISLKCLLNPCFCTKGVLYIHSIGIIVDETSCS